MADENADEYMKLVGLIKDVEAAAPREEQTAIDMSQTFVATAVQAPGRSSYREALKTISAVENTKHIEPKRRAQGQPHLAMAGVQQAATSQFVPSMPTTPQAPQAPQTSPVPQQQFEQPQIKTKVEEEAKQFAARMPLQKVTVNVKRLNMKELVLPSLSMADQISELERIIEGIHESVFDQDHITIVVEEVYGLQQSIEKQEKDLKKKHIELSPLEQSLLALREQRINEAMLELKQRGVI